MMTSFSLHELGWADFQALCHTAAREILGQTVNGFLDNRDGGRDGAFIGTWAQAGQESFAGEFVFQAKHTSLVNSTLSLGGLSDEFDKAERLAAEGRCDVYVLMTNARVTGQSEQRITEDGEFQGSTHASGQNGRVTRARRPLEPTACHAIRSQRMNATSSMNACQ